MTKERGLSKIDLSDFVIERLTLCKAARLSTEMSPDHAAKYLAALVEPSISPVKICSVVKGWGYPISTDVIRRHRNKTCCCE